MLNLTNCKNRAARCGVLLVPSDEPVDHVMTVIENGVFVNRDSLERKKLYILEMFRLENLQAAGVDLQPMQIESHDVLGNFNKASGVLEYLGSAAMASRTEEVQKPVEKTDPVNNENVEQ